MAKNMHLIWEGAYSLQSEWPSGRATVQLADILREIRTTDVPATDFHLLQGYLAYHFPCELTERIDVERELRLALEGDSRNSQALLLLGHLYFDQGRYRPCIEVMERLVSPEFAGCWQLWCELKLREILIAARLHAGQFLEAKRPLEEFVNELWTIAPEDVAIPYELVGALAANKFSLRENWGKAKLNALAKQLRAIVTQIAGETVLDDELLTLVN